MNRKMANNSNLILVIFEWKITIYEYVFSKFILKLYLKMNNKEVIWTKLTFSMEISKPKFDD